MVVRPLPAAPTSSSGPSVGRHARSSRVCSSGTSSCPTTTSPPRDGRVDSGRSSGSGGVHTGRGGGAPLAANAAWQAATIESRSVGPEHTAAGPLDRGRGAAPQPNGTRVTRRWSGGGAARLTCASCATSGPSGPRRSRARPGTDLGRSAASGAPITSTESAASWRRSAMRSATLARMLSLTAPPGRCVARTRFTPRLRPRCAAATSASSTSGTSLASVANSSTTTTRRGTGGADAGGEATVLGHVGGARGAELPLAPAQLGLEAAQRPLGEPAVEVADEADGVGERGQAVEGAAALEVDEQEREQLGWPAEGQPGDERAQQLALARAGGAGHEDVGAVAVEVDLDGAPVGPDADRGDGPAAGGTGRDRPGRASGPRGGARPSSRLPRDHRAGPRRGLRWRRPPRARRRRGARASRPHRGSR